MKLDCGVFAVDYGAVSDKDQWMVRKKFVVEIFEQSSVSEFDMCPKGSVDMRHKDGTLW